MAEFLADVEDLLQSVLPHAAACVGMLDPATRLVTSAHKYGDLAGRDEHDRDWGLIEYGTPEETSFITLSRARVPAASVDRITHGDRRRSRRTRDLIEPRFGYGDELRWVARDAGSTWGGVALFRSAGERAFQEADVVLATRLSSIVGAGLRCGLIAQMASPPHQRTVAPLVWIVDRNDSMTLLTPRAQQDSPGIVPSLGPPALAGGLVAAARRYGRGLCDEAPHCCLRLGDGRWVSVDAVPISRRDGRGGDVVVTMVEMGASPIGPLVASALGLSHREREVTRLVLAGETTAEIAGRLHISTYTVQDHLKAVFEKAGVHSRRELVCKVFFHVSAAFAEAPKGG
ncbi:helix-turn-helix domain-containing protein [Nocardioides donggukensis]|uniref:Helix-turn-helix transcriptional regulator n=1 Tax=Nocardioides donggukensis TaxID=2774019 RepID=A0A927K7N2_9ACTN|nr:helix-turn-helix transcriptional regulator [Nocardioides donggukensis]MBD8869306.1 helix-turn-helix transcriptional regulator [Nocardioides donggukensis]